MKIEFSINDTPQTIEVEDFNTPLLWVIRDLLHLKGTKFGCGEGACGACTVHVNGNAVRSCSYTVKFAEGKNITTIEGLGTAENPHPVQQAWVEEIVPQCGYCQPGQLISAVALLNKNPKPSDDDIDISMSGNICRCGTYVRIRKAIHSAANSGDVKV